MTILRSRSTSEEAHTIEYPVVRESLAAWERRVAEAEARGKAAGLAEAQAKIAAAEQRATAAEQRAATTDARLKADYELRLGQAISALARATAHLETLEHQLVSEAEADIARLAMVVAARVLRREVEDDPTWMDPVLADALAQVPDKRGVAVRMHPEDAQVAGERKRLILESVPGLERLEFFADDGLPRGACIIASQGTRLDASLPSTWERLYRELLSDPRPPLEAVVPPPADATGKQP